MLVVGEREQESGSVSVRRRHSVGRRRSLPFDRFQINIQEEIKNAWDFVDAVGANVAPEKDKVRVNRAIRVPEVRVVERGRPAARRDADRARS